MFDTVTLLLGLIFSSIGFAYYRYGKKRSNVMTQYTGVALMVYPYLVENRYAVLIIGLILMTLPTFIEL